MDPRDFGRRAHYYVSCSWCHELNELTDARNPFTGLLLPVYCRNCGHRGDSARIWCDCPRCETLLNLSSSSTPPETASPEASA